jgi:hypothetical protein
MSSLNGYIDIPITTDSKTLVQTALANIATQLPGWVPREGNLEVLLLEEFGQMAAEIATAASGVPASIFKYFGGLLGLTQQTGVQATIKTLWTLVAVPPTGGYLIPANTIAGFSYQGSSYTFTTTVDTLIPPSSALSGASGDGTTLTLTTLAAHGFQAGTVVTVSGDGTNTYNGDYTILTTPTPTTFTVASTVSGTATLSGAVASVQSAFITMKATDVGSFYNIYTLSGLNPLTTYLTPTATSPYLANILVTATAASDATLTTGVDAETDSAYLNRLVVELGLIAPRPITTNDYASLAQNVVGIYRALAIDGFNPYNNILSANDANLTTAIYNNYTAVGNGTATLPTVSLTGGSLVVTAATMTATTTTASVTTSGTQLAVTTATLDTSVSSTHPALVFITDPTNGNEIVVITSVNGTGNKKWNLLPGTTFQYPHGTGVTVTPLQGVIAPNVSSLNPNTSYMQSSAIVQCGTGTTATAKPYVVSVVTYLDGSIKVYSSANPISDSLYDYTVLPKTVVTNINSYAGGFIAPTNPNNNYNTIQSYATSVQSYIVFANATSTRTHKILYTALNQTSFDFSATGLESPILSVDDYNWLPDSELYAYGSTGTALSSWTLDSGISPLPGYGMQFQGTGSALGSSLNAKSQIFNLSNTTVTNFTAIANIDATYTGSTYGDIVVKVVNAATGATIASASPTSASFQTVAVPFSVPTTGGATSLDVYVQVVFGTGLNVPLISSVIVSALSVSYGTKSPATVGEAIMEPGYVWTPGGQFNQNVFNNARTVTVAPIDGSGLAVNASVADSLHDYLQSRREVNFNVSTINPNYVPINVQWSGIASQGYDPVIVQNAGNAAVYNFINPGTWAGGGNTPAFWDSTQNTVRILDVAGVLSQVTGMAAVTSVVIGTTTNLAATDIFLPGNAPLPVANSVTGSVVSNALNSTIGGV